MKPMLSPIYDISMLEWLPVGPFDDPAAHLMAPIRFGDLPMVVHAIAAGFDPQLGRMTASTPTKQFLIGAAEQVVGAPYPLRTLSIDGRDYVLVAVPNIDSRRLS